ncbi:MAG: glycosyl transferase family protein [Parcubacteria group bacterium Athens0714_26]|nr:MAG: glycosyl transferase family protein [Parcubacteria group bacterium Athens1014_26]TSD03643.1 MAG: glycosyl transferase family protein [Parcubacteria group bacterium Athens0714_26]
MDNEDNNLLVSIGLPVYNGVPRIRQALNCLLGQEYKNIELIISDNASTDETRKICEEYAKNDNRIRYIRQEKNLGQVNNITYVIKEAKGEYFMLASDDDFWDPEFISILKPVLDKYSQYGVAMSSVLRVYDDGSVRDEVCYTGELNLTNLNYSRVFEMMFSERPIHWFCGLFRTKLLQNLLRIPFPKCKAHDRVFMCELALATHFYSLPNILYKKTGYRQSVSERYSNDEIGAALRDNKRHFRYVWAVVSRVIRSRNIPLGRKLRILPIYLTIFLWRNRVFLRELSPRIFEGLQKVKHFFYE